MYLQTVMATLFVCDIVHDQQCCNLTRHNPRDSEPGFQGNVHVSVQRQLKR